MCVPSPSHLMNTWCAYKGLIPSTVVMQSASGKLHNSCGQPEINSETYYFINPVFLLFASKNEVAQKKDHLYHEKIADVDSGIPWKRLWILIRTVDADDSSVL